MHILNGDALKEYFPNKLMGNIIIMRECLVDGDVSGQHMDDFFDQRSAFLHRTYGVPKDDYTRLTVPEIMRIYDIAEQDEVNLWFEDDLFCQVNLWFLLHHLYRHTECGNLYLVKPDQFSKRGFGKYGTDGLISLYERRIRMKYLPILAGLWEAYTSNDLMELKRIAVEIADDYPHIDRVVDAHQQRQPSQDTLGRPHEVIKEIILELETDDFEIIFSEFCERAWIYGYGDLMVRKLYDEVLDQLNC